jgi:Tol biopolymer transport system component
MNAQRYGTILAAVVAAVLVATAASSLATTWDVQPFVSTLANEYFALWSPDAQQLAYVSDATGLRQLYIVNADGTGTWQVTNDSNGVYDVVWAPDSQSLVYTQSQSVPKDLIKVQLSPTRDTVASTTNLTNETQTATWKDARFSPDGSLIVANRQYSTTWRIYRVQPDGSGVAIASGSYATYPAWNADGSLVAYALSGSTSGYSNIYLYNLASSVKLVGSDTTNLKIRAFAWSPTGDRIAFSAPYEQSNSYLGVVNSDGSGYTVLDAGPAACEHQAYAWQEDIWSADGTQLVYSFYEGGVWNVYTINADGTGKELVAASTGSDIQPRFFGGGRVCFISDRSGNWDIYVSSPPPTNQPPVADAGGPYIAPATSWDGAEVELNGTGSSDPDGDPLLYSWQIDGLEIGTDPVMTYEFPIGQTDVTLTVFDPSGESDTAETTVTVTVIEVDIDIRPFSQLNFVNPGSHGVLPVAFLTDETFDAATIDPWTITVAGREFGGLVKIVRGWRNPLPLAMLVDVDGDGDDDLLAMLEIQNLALDPTTTVCVLGALTYDGCVVQGEDTVWIWPR